MKQYPHIHITFNGRLFVLFVNGEKYAVADNTETLSECINYAIEDYLDEV